DCSASPRSPARAWSTGRPRRPPAPGRPPDLVPRGAARARPPLSPSRQAETVAEMLLHLGRDDPPLDGVGERRRDRRRIGAQALLAQLADDPRQPGIVVLRLERARVHLLLQFLQLLDEALNRDRCHPQLLLWRLSLCRAGWTSPRGPRWTLRARGR